MCIKLSSFSGVELELEFRVVRFLVSTLSYYMIVLGFIRVMRIEILSDIYCF